MGIKYMKTSKLVAWNCKTFTYGFLGFRLMEHKDMKLQSNTSYMTVTKSSKLDNISHTNLIQDSFKIEAKVMEINDPIARECKIFTHDFLGFRPIDIRGNLRSKMGLLRKIIK